MISSGDFTELRARVAAHIGAAALLEDGRMRCPACGGDDFGPTACLQQLACYEATYLPGAPLLAGLCWDCNHITEPKSTPVVLTTLCYPDRVCPTTFPVDESNLERTGAEIAEHLMSAHLALPTLWAIDRMHTWDGQDA
ncbi:hypothetical protein [Streptosporangium roseum]|uniref:hypothetical protein n=1 Tax=Streptosporangium roseum TaxID=2001 RepID=UPI0004CC996C|nr:hypothetical protein [Streptosporangium roseum]